MLLTSFTYHGPQNLKEACALVETLEDARLLAGGTFLVNNLKQMKKNGKAGPKHVISLQQIAELRQISLTSDVLIIGAMTTMQNIMDNDDIRTLYPEFAKIASKIATTPLRHMATIGGNITSRYVWTEWPAVLLSMEAQLIFMTRAGENIISMQHFIDNQCQAPGILSKVIIPKRRHIVLNYQRIAKTTSVDLPLLAVIIKAQIKDQRYTNVRVCINTCETYAQRDHKLESLLNAGTPIDTIISTLPQHLETANYKTDDGFKHQQYGVALKYALTAIKDRAS